MIHQQISQCVTHFAAVTSLSLNSTSGCDKETQVERNCLFALTSATLRQPFGLEQANEPMATAEKLLLFVPSADMERWQRGKL